MLTIITFVIVLGIMIVVHEFGHFMVAKRLGVKVEAFSLGMGPALLKKKWGETEYRLSAFPIGGYVKMLGESPGETDDEIPPQDMGRSFYGQSPLKRIAITAAGPFLNLALATALAPAIYMMGIEVPAYLNAQPVVVGYAPDSPADRAGFEYGDKIISVDGKKPDTWQEVEEYFALNPNKRVEIKVERSGKVLDISMKLGESSRHGRGISGFTPLETTVIGAFTEDSPAKKAGLKEGDRVVAIAGKEAKTFSSMKRLIQEAAPGPFTITALRGNERVRVKVRPKLVREADGEQRYLIGVSPRAPMEHIRYGPVRSFREGVGFLWNMAAANVVALGKLITGRISTKALGGPVEIGFLVGSARRAGFSYLVQVTSLISLLLGIINFFPIPALDGGHIMFASMELVSRRKLNRKVVDIMNTAGFALLMTLIVLVTIQDLMRHKSGILEFFGFG